MARMTKAEKAFDKKYDAAFRAHAYGVQFMVMDLGKMRKMAKADTEAGMTMEEAMHNAIVMFRK